MCSVRQRWACLSDYRRSLSVPSSFHPEGVGIPGRKASKATVFRAPDSSSSDSSGGHCRIISVGYGSILVRDKLMLTIFFWRILAITPGDVNPAVDGSRPSKSPRNTALLTSPAIPPVNSRGSISIDRLLTQSSRSERPHEAIGTPSVQSLPSTKQDHSTGLIISQNTSTVTSRASLRVSAIPFSIPEENNQDRAEIGFFLRHFADGGGQWMDICTGQRSYFSQYIVQLASQSPLLRYSACALAAKQIGQMQSHSQMTHTTPRSKMTASCILRPNMDFIWYGAKYYEKAILLMAHQISHYSPTNKSQSHLSPDEIYRSPDSEHSHLDDHENMSSAFRVLSACILCSYEDLNATMRAWTGHLDGINKLLSPHLSSVNFCCIPQPMRALEVSFWYFTLNDMLNSCE